MIARIKGILVSKKTGSALIENSGFTYEVYLPPAVLLSISANIGEPVEFVTYHYLVNDQSKSIPVIIGFTNDVEREFFEKFITVSGIGPKAACKALSLPFARIADAIAKADMKVLKSLPGIGETKAKEIIAKLQDKVGKFGLIQDKSLPATGVPEDIRQEAVSILLQLQYKKSEAENMVDLAVKRNPGIKSSEDILNEVYKQRAGSLV